VRPAEADRVERYLAELTAALAPLAPRERSEIVQEARTHIVERLGRREGDLDIILQDMGPAAEYAAPFLDGHEAPAPLPHPSRPRAVRWMVGAAAAVLQAFAVLVAVLALYELAAPGDIGLWVQQATDASARTFRFSIGGETPPGDEILGWLLVPLALLLGVALLAAARLLRRRS
jgi:hypothetical protein